MNELELQDFAARLHLKEISLSERQPFAFTLDQKLYCTLEYQAAGALLLTLSFAVPEYDHETLPRAFELASYTGAAQPLHFAVAVHQGQLCLLTELPQQVSGAEAVNRLLQLVEVYQQIAEH